MKKIGLFFGGMGNESEVSIMSARNVVKNLDYERFALVLIFWHKNGDFYCVDGVDEAKEAPISKKIVPSDFRDLFDIALPVTHGKYGEDGVLQGIFEWQKIAYCGCRVLGAATCMDKSFFKNVIAGLGIKQVNYIALDFSIASEGDVHDFFEHIKGSFPLPIFVKPANSGSSVGIVKVKAYADLPAAVQESRKHDSKIIVEAGLEGPREIEVAVLGNGELIISDPGELIPGQEFYDYDDKYVLGKSKVSIPAELTEHQKAAIRNITEKAYRACDCRGFARVDFFIHGDEVFLNEINTLPGLTDISMYPLLMKQAGITYKDLLSRIIDLAY